MDDSIDFTLSSSLLEDWDGTSETVNSQVGHFLATSMSDELLASFDVDLAIPNSSAENLQQASNQGEEAGTSTCRFSESFSPEAIETIGAESMPENTRKKIKWATTLFNDWATVRGYPLLLAMDTAELPKILSRFIVEARKENGQVYPAKTLYEIVSSIQRMLRESGNHVSFFDRANNDYYTFRKVLDGIMKRRTRDGVGLEHKIAKEISSSEEDFFWESNAFSLESPRGLLNTVFYYTGLRLQLRGGREMYDLCRAKIKIEHRGERKWLIYQEFGSKAASGGLRDRKSQPKTVEVPEDSALGERCLVRIVELYLSKCDDSVQHFFCRPIDNPKFDGKWFSTQRLGINYCKGMLKKISQRAGISGNVTNHSMRRTGISRLSHAGFDDQKIATISGHRSNAIQVYKTVKDAEKEAMGRAATCKMTSTTEKCTEMENKENVDIEVFKGNNNKPPVSIHFHGQCNVTINYN